MPKLENYSENFGSLKAKKISEITFRQEMNKQKLIQKRSTYFSIIHFRASSIILSPNK